MPVTFKDLMESGVHFGSPAARWSPAMKPYIYNENNHLHIINLRETLKGLIRACHFLEKITSTGRKVLFVGTKRQAGEIVRQEAQRCNSYFVVHRWLGGTLTNMNTMRKRIARLNELETLETNGEIEHFSKKMISSLTREKKKIFRNFEGIRAMDGAPGAMIIVDPKQEANAVAEAMRLDIPLIALVDSDTNPEPIDFIIPGNDDSQRSIQVILGALADAVLEGSKKASLAATINAREKEAAAAAANAARQRGGERGGDRNDERRPPKKEVAVPENLSAMGAFTMPDEDNG